MTAFSSQLHSLRHSWVHSLWHSWVHSRVRFTFDRNIVGIFEQLQYVSYKCFIKSRIRKTLDLLTCKDRSTDTKKYIYIYSFFDTRMGYFKFSDLKKEFWEAKQMEGCGWGQIWKTLQFKLFVCTLSLIIDNSVCRVVPGKVSSSP